GIVRVFRATSAAPGIGVPRSREISAVTGFVEFLSVGSLAETDESNDTGRLHMTIPVIVSYVSGKVGHLLDVPVVTRVCDNPRPWIDYELAVLFPLNVRVRLFNAHGDGGAVIENWEF